MTAYDRSYTIQTAIPILFLQKWQAVITEIRTIGELPVGLNIASFYILQVHCAVAHILHATSEGEKIEQVQHEPPVVPKTTLPTMSMVPGWNYTRIPHNWQDNGYWVRFNHTTAFLKFQTSIP
ncbi:hypothetical protein Asppvi_007780 [Aspergillus pseudoviridinutans]|uniref:Uncharacterized protein n=1 Tax=Aspergillus pseudoviridinutans TaxID=1517512 RepID=A0A9P3EWS6_9EURO|nr:uncharacterized protein Asppvi_007780 [Aspergillus pseudoviridinutans]GIJ88852.1 hypothetical protein Asppvi_007780 [Aspergillus pseudoviridinutans]